MKKYNLLKVITITMMAFLLLSWIIPAGAFSSGAYTNNGYEPVGLLDIILSPLNFFNWTFSSRHLWIDGGSVDFYSYTNIILALLSIGIFYKVLNKTGAYGKLVEDLVKKVKNNKEIILISSILFFTLFSSLTGLSLLAFLLVPFVITVLLKLGYSRVAALGSTVLAIFVGRIGAITSTEITGISNVLYSLDIKDNLAFKLILLIIFTAILVIYVLRSKTLKNETEEDPLYDGIVIKEKSYAPIIILSTLFFGILFLCMFNWYYVFNITNVTDAYESLMSSTIGGYPIASNIFGMMEPFGYWTGFTMSAMLIVLSLIIGFIYSVSFEELTDGLKEGTKKMAPTALYVILACTIMVLLMGSESNILITITNWIYENVAKMTVPFTAIATSIYSFFINDFFALSSKLFEMETTYFTGANLSLSVLTMQFIHGLLSMVAPTSIFLVAGLSYLSIPYKTWISYIWKFILIVLVVGIGLLMLISII